MPAFASELPEHDHNEIVGWARGRAAASAPSSSRTREGDERAARRVEVTAELAAEGAAVVERVRARGETRLERLVSLVLLGDLVSLYLAVLRGVDPVHVGRSTRSRSACAHARAGRRGRGPDWRRGANVGVMPDTATSTRTAASIIDGRELTDAPGGRLESTNPADLADVVAEVLLADADGFVAACRAARARAARVGRGARAGARAGDRRGRPAGRGQQGGARPGWSPARSASRTPRRSARCRRSSTPATSSSARAAGSTARPSRREMPDKQLFTFRVPVGVAAIITAGNFPVAVPSWYLVPALLCGNAVVWKPAEYAAAIGHGADELFAAGGVPDGRAQPRPRRRRGDLRRARARARRSGSSTRSASPAPPPSGAGSASCAAATCSRRAWSWAARTRWW